MATRASRPQERDTPSAAAPLLGRGREHLRERPLVSLGVAAGVATVAERQVDQLLDDGRAFCLCAVIVRVDGGDEDVNEGRSPHLGRVSKALRRLAGVDAAA
jgi:hypothetical protein